MQNCLLIKKKTTFNYQQTCRNKKKAIEIRKKDADGDKLIFKYDIVIMKEEAYPYIIHRSENNVYVWNLESELIRWICSTLTNDSSKAIRLYSKEAAFLIYAFKTKENWE